MNLQQELAALRARIDELEAQAKTEEADSWPKMGDKFYRVDAYGYCDDVWQGGTADMAMLNCGNVFRTEEEAKREVERRTVLTELRKLAKASGKCDWADDAQYKWQIRFMHDSANGGEFGVVNWHSVQYQGAVAFATEAAAKSAIKTIGADRLMLLLED